MPVSMRSARRCESRCVSQKAIACERASGREAERIGSGSAGSGGSLGDGEGGGRERGGRRRHGCGCRGCLTIEEAVEIRRGRRVVRRFFAAISRCL
eukprot:scaffold25008_cov31-Tisochrysis_lutea.AAC.6